MALIIVGMADMKLGRPPDTVTTLGLGSCIGVTLFESSKKMGGMVHIMLPYSNGAVNENRAKFADTGIVDLVNALIRSGASRAKLVAKMAGGAHMFGNPSGKNSILNVGDRNYDACLKVLSHLRIPIAASDTGGSHGRTIELNCETGMLRIKTIGYGEKTI